MINKNFITLNHQVNFNDNPVIKSHPTQISNHPTSIQPHNNHPTHHIRFIQPL